jgi:hypothetical protein
MIEYEPLEVGDLNAFAAEVEPVLEERCGSGGCHGRRGQPFAIYVPGAYRADDRRTYLDEPLDAAELEQNAWRLSACAHGEKAERSDALCKPLAVAAGGCGHEGGDVFADTRDSGYRAILAWLKTRAPLPTGGP